MPVGNPPALPDTGPGAPSSTSSSSSNSSTQNTASNAVVLQPGFHVQPGTNNVPGTITNDKTNRVWQPAYYDLETGTAYRYPGIFLTGMAFSRDVDTRKLSPWGKATYYAGRAAGALGLGYGLGVIGGSLLGASSRATAIAGRIAEFGSRHPFAASAARGTMKGLLVGGEAAKGIKMKTEGYGWGDVVGTIGTDFAGLYAFERGMNSAFVSTRRNVVRKQFAEKNSRFFAGETYKGSYIVKDDPSQVRLTRTLRNNEMVLEFKPKRPHPPKSIPKHDIAKLPQEVPTNDAFITGTINTKSKPFTTFKVEKPKTSDYIKPSEDTKLIDLSDELKFLESEKDLPPQLYTEKEIVTKVFDSGKVSGSTVSTGSGTEQVLKTDAITITKLNIGRTRLNEATRISGLKSDYMRMMKDAMPKIRGLGDSISKAASGAFGAVMGASGMATPSASASGSKPTTGSSSGFSSTPLFKTGAGFGSIWGEFPGMKPEQGSKPKQETSTGTRQRGYYDVQTTDYKFWTGVGNVYAEFEMHKPKPTPPQVPQTTPSEDIRSEDITTTPDTEDSENTEDSETWTPFIPPMDFQIPKQEQTQTQKPQIKLAPYVPKLEKPKWPRTRPITIAPLAFGFSLPRGRSGGSGAVSKKKRWSKKNQWGELSLGLDSLKKSLKSMKSEAMEGFAAMPEFMPKSKRKSRPKRPRKTAARKRKKSRGKRRR